MEGVESNANFILQSHDGSNTVNTTLCFFCTFDAVKLKRNCYLTGTVMRDGSRDCEKGNREVVIRLTSALTSG